MKQFFKALGKKAPLYHFPFPSRKKPKTQQPYNFLPCRWDDFSPTTNSTSLIKQRACNCCSFWISPSCCSHSRRLIKFFHYIDNLRIRFTLHQQWPRTCFTEICTAGAHGVAQVVTFIASKCSPLLLFTDHSWINADFILKIPLIIYQTIG